MMPNILCIEIPTYRLCGFAALWDILHDRKYTHSQANRMHYTAIRCFTKELHKSNNYFTLFTSFALQRRKLVIFNPQMYKNRQHSTEAECRLFCCPILLSRCRFCNFLKLLSYQHTAKSPLFFCPSSAAAVLRIRCGRRAIPVLAAAKVLAACWAFGVLYSCARNARAHTKPCP